MNILKNILLLLFTLIFAIILTVVWKEMYVYFLHRVEYPWGNAQSYYDPYNWMKLTIHNGVQFIYICSLFFQVIYVYSRCCSAMTFSINHKYWYLTILSLSWLLLCMISFVLTNASCCPGVYRVIFNPLDWLIYPEFLLFYGLGQIYLTNKIVKVVNDKSACVRGLA